MDARKHLAPAALAILAALAQLRMIVLVFGTQYARSVDAARGIVAGKPHWRIYQSRVLGPWIVEAFSKVFPTFIAAHVFVSIAALVAAGLVAWRLGESFKARAFAFVAFHALFVVLLAKPWLYVWDFFDVVVFLLFTLFVVEKRPWQWFVALAFVGMLNHEIAGFVAVWLILAPLFDKSRPRSQMVAGVATLGAGAIVVEILRGALLVEEIGPKLMPDAPKDIGSSTYFALPRNLKVIAEIFTYWDHSFPILVIVLSIVCLAGAYVLAKKETVRFGALAATYAMMVVSLFVFGTLLETRIYVVLIPFVMLLALRGASSTSTQS